MRLVVALLVWLCLSQSAWAFKKFDPGDKEQQDELQEVRALIAGGRQLDEQLKDARKNLEKAPTDKLKARYSAQIERLTRDRGDKYNHAIWLTIQAYDIAPLDKESPPKEMLKNSVNKGNKTVIWVPLYDEGDKKIVVNEHGVPNKEPYTYENTAGTQVSDGTAWIFPGAFKNPGLLASIIIHEQLHFAQFTTPGKTLSLTRAEREVKAYEKEQELFKDGSIGFTAAEKAAQEARLSGLLAEKRKDAADEVNQVKKTGRPIPEVEIKSRTPEQLKAIMKSAAALKERVIEEVQEREENSTMLGVLSKLQSLARTICFDKGSWRVSDAANYGAACAMVPEGRNLADFVSGVVGYGMDYCSEKVARILITCGDQADVEHETGKIAAPAPPVGMEPPRQPPAKMIPPGSSSRERSEDKKTLTALHQAIVDVCYDLCQDPSDAWDKYDDLCRDLKKSRAIDQKYTNYREQSPGADWKGVQSSDCGWEFWHDIKDDHGQLCYGTGEEKTASAHWFEGRAAELNRSYHPPAPPPSRIERPPSRGGDSERGRPSPCGPGCTWDGSICHCPPN